MAGSQDSRARAASSAVISLPWFLLWEERSPQVASWVWSFRAFSREAELVVTSVGHGGGKERNHKSSEKKED